MKWLDDLKRRLGWGRQPEEEAPPPSDLEMSLPTPAEQEGINERQRELLEKHEKELESREPPERYDPSP